MMNVYMKEKTRVFCQNSFDDLDDNIGIGNANFLQECDVDEDFTEGIESWRHYTHSSVKEYGTLSRCCLAGDYRAS